MIKKSAAPLLTALLTSILLLTKYKLKNGVLFWFDWYAKLNSLRHFLAAIQNGSYFHRLETL